MFECPAITAEEAQSHFDLINSNSSNCNLASRIPKATQQSPRVCDTRSQTSETISLAQGKRMNSNIDQSKENRTKKRVFEELNSPIPLSNMSTKINNSEENIADSVSLDTSSDAGREAKRSRKVSPRTEAKKLSVHEKDVPLLPIISDADLPDPKESKAEPDDYLKELVKAMYGVDVKVRNGLDLGEEYFKPVTEAQQAAYTMEVLTPARENDVNTLKELVAAKGPQVVNCVNRFGESLLNLACRRGFTEVAEFLLSDEINLDVRLKDDFGRTPLHDACWHPKPQKEICSWLINRDPSLLLVTDKRGNTPFMYARAEDFPTWRQFLFDNRDSLQLLMEPSTLKQFC